MLDSNRLQRLQQTSLWDFALTFYAKPGVEQACLVLQDHVDVDVCELLFHSWLYQHGLQAAQPALAEARKEREYWQQTVTMTLRQLRRELKPQAIGNDAIAKLRKLIQQAELQAERENLQRWQQWAWQASNHNQRLKNCAISQHDVEKWLQNQLFYRPVDSGGRSVSPVCEEGWEALHTLARQLDHHE